MNNCGGFTASYVEIHGDINDAPAHTVLRLWAFLNSSVAWLLREATGRKNLGGGMLKAEAWDLKALRIYLELEPVSTIEEIYETLRCREAVDSLTEIYSHEHRALDQIVFEHLGIKSVQSASIVDSLRFAISQRQERART